MVFGTESLFYSLLGTRNSQTASKKLQRMTILATALGAQFERRTVTVTPRMALAYAAGIGCKQGCYLDDARPGGLIAPPPICTSLEWLITGDPATHSVLGITPEERLRAVHAGQDTQFHRPLIVGETVSVSGRIDAIRATRAGTCVTSQLRVTGLGDNDPITTSLCDAIYRGVETDAPALHDDDTKFDPRLTTTDYIKTTTIPVSRLFPHVYSECASIWNPIHTERCIAIAAGLPDIIVHGTALWALVWKQLSETYGDLSVLSGRFTAMVIPGQPVTLRVGRQGSETRTLDFRLDNDRGEPAINAGHATFARE
jgi:acyl dehydratase